MYAHIAIARPLDTALTYEIPSNLKSRVVAGVRVEVPLGRSREIGWVLSTCATTELNEKRVRPVYDVIDSEILFPIELLNLFSWAANYYLTSPGFFCRAAMPPGLSDRQELKIKICEKGACKASRLAGKSKLTVNDKILVFLSKNRESTIEDLKSANFGKNIHSRCYRLEQEGLLTVEHVIKVRKDYLLRKPASVLSQEYRVSPDAARARCNRAPMQLKILDYLADREEPVLNENIIRNLNITSAPLRSLREKGFITTVSVQQERGHLYPEYEGLLDNPPSLTVHQKRISDIVADVMNQPRFQSFLLRGVTGSGKTEIYLSLSHKAIEHGRTALILVPEISLTPQLYRRFQRQFGDEVALLHSGLPAGERFEQWYKIKKGRAKIAIGTRSAVFAPLPDLGIVIVDEEHDGSFKQEDTPRYNGRDLAIKRAQLANVPVLLGSATPSIESYYRARRGDYHLLELTERYGKQDLPKVTIVNMRKEYEEAGLQQEISRLLDQKIRDTREDGKQVLILINRRGYRSRLLCRECGKIMLCDNCNVAMKYHQANRKMVCHFCDLRKSVTDRCEKCGGELIEFVGIGTQRVEEILQTDFRDSVVMRMDHDTTRSKGSHYHILKMLQDGKIDILVGTQMIAKGHDYPKITLVGVVSAESILALPDFRHSEKTFQLLTQVAGRSGRGEAAGEVIVQTFEPEHYSIKYAKMHDYVSFYEHEIYLRQRLGYPPFSRMALIRFEGKEKQKVFEKASSLRVALDRFSDDATVIRGPKSAPLSRLRDRYRIQIIIRSPTHGQLHSLLVSACSSVRKNRVFPSDYIVDIDPYNMM